MSKQTFVANTILTAAQMNTLQANDYNQTVSTKTANYVLVATDAGTKIVMNAAGSTSITVNTSLFTAGDNLTIANIGAGVCTVTAGTATVSSAGPLAIPQYGGGTLYFTSAGVSVYSPTAVTVAASSGLTFLVGGTQTATASASITNIFTSSYTTYKIILRNLSSSVNIQDLIIRLGNSGTADTGSNYNSRGLYWATSGQTTGGANQDNWSGLVNHTANALNYLTMEVTGPNLAATTAYSAQSYSNAPATQSSAGVLNTATQYTDIFFSLTSGNIAYSYQVFGYANS